MERTITSISEIFRPTLFPGQYDTSENTPFEKQQHEIEENNALDRPQTLSLNHPVPSKCIREIPNGGLRAWLQVLGSFFLFFNTWGVTNAFGVFETYYASGYLANTSDSDISIIGAVQAFFLLASGLVVGPLFDRGYFYHLIVVGSFLTCFGMMMTSLCTEYYQVLLAQGLCVGFGSGCLFVPSVAIIPTWFTTKRILAAGMAASGGSIGGIVYPITFYYLRPRVGYPWAIRIIGFLMLATFGISITVMRVRMHTTERKKVFDPAAFRELPFSLFTLGAFFGFMGLYIPFFYISSFSLSTKEFSPDLAFYTLIIMNASSTFGRVLPNYIADKIGPLNVIAPCACVTAILAWCWIAIHSKPSILVFCVFYGFFSGSFVSLPPMTIVSLTTTLDVIGARMGMVFAICGCGLFIGSPVAGVILSSTGQYLGLQALCASAVSLCASGLILARLAKAGDRLVVKA